MCQPSLSEWGRVRSIAAKVCAALGTVILVTRSFAATSSSLNTPQFNRDIRPVLAEHCFTCHGPDSAMRKADLRLDTQEGAHASVVVPGDANASEIIERITSDDPEVQMPPPESKIARLTAEQIKSLSEWIDDGAKYEPHWAYIPPQRPPLPTVVGSHLLRNPIDCFLLARIEKAGLEPSPEADRATLVRRLYLDVTGLPPSPTQIDDFAADTRSDAYEQLVTRLLESPAFAERMATWWFDLVRFATTVGYLGDQDQRVTPYRDYVIKSFNENLPFDQFTIEQLAGDLLPNPTMWQQVATGYNRVLRTTDEGGAQDEEYRAIYLADRVRNFSETWMASSMGCSQCHDHKFDPFTQEDFYSLAAFFADVDEYGSFNKIGIDTLPTQRPPEMLAWTLPVFEKMKELDSRIAKADPALVGWLKVGWEQQREELIQLKRERLDLEAQFVPTLITKAVPPHEVRVLPRGNWMDKSGKVVQPQTPHFLRQLETADRRANRLDLARWLVSRDHPLTARVVVNRLWKMYFGIGLSKELIDMGSRGEIPQNQELLDWLAVEFMDSGWNIKHMVRLMVTSTAYRQTSVTNPDSDAIDPENRLVARQSRFRLEAEQIRDNALCISGLLVNRLGGDIVKPYQPAKYYAALNWPEREYEASKGENQFRRSVYVHWQRQYVHPWLLAFDAPSREECTAQRSISSTPTAALVLLNDPSFGEAARVLAERIVEKGPQDDSGRLQWAWRQVLGRNASSAEVDRLQSLLNKHRDQYANDKNAAKAILSVGISKQPEKADVVELAAWTSVSRVLLNLNETITRN
jgi:hypothetical protein